jgi:hypothetical protein
VKLKMSDNGFVRKKLQNTIKGSEQMLSQSMYIHTHAFHMHMSFKCGLKVYVYGGGRKKFFHLRLRKTPDRLWFKEKQD